jgi:hypothetical protein
MLTAADAIRLTRRHVESRFPLTCSCGKVYPTLAAYLRETRHLGPPVSYDGEMGIWTPRTPIGTVSMANCTCGTTLGVNTDGMPLRTMWQLLLWARFESWHRHVSLSELLRWVREQIDAQVLAEDEPPAGTAR